jgi:hypothetical protein
MKEALEKTDEDSTSATDQDRREQPKVTVLIVNARPKSWDEKHITFRQVVVLAYGQFEDNPVIEYTVAYSNGPRPNERGSMVDGDKVKVQDGMNFNVTRTDKS